VSKDVWPVFAPDGKRLVFQSDRDGGWKLFELNLSDGKTRQISFHSEGARPTAGLPTARPCSPSSSGLQRRQVDGARGPRSRRRAGPGKDPLRQRRKRAEPVARRHPRAVHNRGDELYRKRLRSSNASQIWLYDLKGKRYTCVVKRETESRTPLWTPDGKGFYYVSGEGGAMNVVHRDLGTGQERPVTRFADDSVIHPSLSADGRTLVFRHLFDFYRVDPTQPEQAPQKIALQHGAAALRPASRRRTTTRAGTTTSRETSPSATAACRSPLRRAATCL
jgi:Tol biopolymer transport system component